MQRERYFRRYYSSIRCAKNWKKKSITREKENTTEIETTRKLHQETINPRPKKTWIDPPKI